MKQQNSIGLLEEPDFSSTANGPIQMSSGGGAGQSEIMIGKFNNTVVLKKGQLNQVLKNQMGAQPNGPGVGATNSVNITCEISIFLE